MLFPQSCEKRMKAVTRLMAQYPFYPDLVVPNTSKVPSDAPGCPVDEPMLFFKCANGRRLCCRCLFQADESRPHKPLSPPYPGKTVVK